MLHQPTELQICCKIPSIEPPAKDNTFERRWILNPSVKHKFIWLDLKKVMHSYGKYTNLRDLKTSIFVEQMKTHFYEKSKVIESTAT